MAVARTWIFDRPSVWEAVQSENGNCLGRQCPRYKECFFYQARRRVHNADLMVVNHALFVSDLALRDSGFGLLPEYDVAILDEAHTLEAVAGEHLGLQLSSLGVDFTLARLYNERSQKGLLGVHNLNEAIHQLQRTRMAADDFFDRVADWFTANIRGLQRPGPRADRLARVLREELRKLSTAIGEGAKPIERPEHRVELVAAEERCRALATEISTWIRQMPSDSVYWVEVENKGRPRIRLAARRPWTWGQACASCCLSKVPTCVLTSATLCVGSPPKFDFIKSRLGLTSAETLALGSPFDYARQVTVHMPKNLPDPSDQPDSFEQAAIRAIAHYLERTQGKAFVLFTSYKMLEAAARALDPLAGPTQHRPVRPKRRHAAFEDGRSFQGRHQQRHLRRGQLLARRGRPRRGTLERHHHPAAVFRTQPPPAGGAARGHPQPRRQPVHRVPGARSRDQAQARVSAG